MTTKKWLPKTYDGNEVVNAILNVAAEVAGLAKGTQASTVDFLKTDPEFAGAVKMFVMDALVMGLQTSEFRDAVLQTVEDGIVCVPSGGNDPVRVRRRET